MRRTILGLGLFIFIVALLLGGWQLSKSRSVQLYGDFVTRVETRDRVAALPFRPPYGKRLFLLPRYLAKNDRSTVLWSIEPESYRAIASDAERIAAHVEENVQQ